MDGISNLSVSLFLGAMTMCFVGIIPFALIAKRVGLKPITSLWALIPFLGCYIFLNKVSKKLENLETSEK